MYEECIELRLKFRVVCFHVDNKVGENKISSTWEEWETLFNWQWELVSSWLVGRAKHVLSSS